MARPEDRFRQSVTLALISGLDAYGRPTTGTQSTAAARVQQTRQVVSDSTGTPIQAAYKLYTASALTTRHRVWISGADTGQVTAARRVIQADPFVDGEGTTRYWVVWLA